MNGEPLDVTFNDVLTILLAVSLLVTAGVRRVRQRREVGK
jgi:hypothetical protein